MSLFYPSKHGLQHIRNRLVKAKLYDFHDYQNGLNQFGIEVPCDSQQMISYVQGVMFDHECRQWGNSLIIGVESVNYRKD